jgi:hypothetical protein
VNVVAESPKFQSTGPIAAADTTAPFTVALATQVLATAVVLGGEAFAPLLQLIVNVGGGGALTVTVVVADPLAAADPVTVTFEVIVPAAG